MLYFQGLRSVGFYGSGFAEYDSVSLAQDETGLSISFSTTATDALLLLAKNVNGDVSIKLSTIVNCMSVVNIGYPWPRS